MRPILITLTLFFVSHSFTLAQERIWTKQTKISEIIAFEKEINPSAKFLLEKISLSKEYYPLIDKYQVTNPVVVQREALNYLPINAEYFYTPGDSIVRLISYDWELNRYGNFFDKQKTWIAEGSKLNIYNDEYERIKKDILTKLGSPIVVDTGLTELNSDGQKYLFRETKWENKSFIATINQIFAATTHRIRFILYFKE